MPATGATAAPIPLLALCDEVEHLLLFVTYWISAWLGVVVVDWGRCRGRVCVTELRDFGRLRCRARR
jgi:hypothetical protein